MERVFTPFPLADPFTDFVMRSGKTTGKINSVRRAYNYQTSPEMNINVYCALLSTKSLKYFYLFCSECEKPLSLMSACNDTSCREVLA